MAENLVEDGAGQDALFTVYADPPWLLHLSGELDLFSAPALTIALEGPTKHGGTIGLDLAELTYMDSTGIHVILNAVSLLGERGRVVLFNPSPIASTPHRGLWTRRHDRHQRRPAPHQLD